MIAGISRRRLLGLLAGGLLGTLFRLPLTGRDDRTWKEVLGQRLLEQFGSNEHAARVGQIYLASLPVEPDAGQLADEIVTGIPINRRARAANGGAGGLHDAIRELIREDFQSGRTATVDGWILSKTEVRLCVVAHLRQRAA